jgi:iron complex outermembrane recepter protein
VRRVSKIVISILLAGVATSALAQTSSRAEPDQIKEIVVTAQKRTEKLIDVPISITALSAEQLEQSARRNVRDLQYAVPNLTTYSGYGEFNTNIIVRGFESSARNVGFESSLGVYVDGVFTGRTQSFTQDLDDVERLEVLRGPQGTLFGKNTTTGAISITTKRPGNDFEGNAKLEGGNFGYIRTGLSLSGPIVTDKLAVKVSGFTASRDGYVENVITPGEPAADNDKSYGVRGEIRFTPTESLDIALRGDFSHKSSFPYQGEVIATLENPLDLPTDYLVPGIRTISAERDNESRDLYGGSLAINYTLGNKGVLTSITALRGLKFMSGGDADSTPLDIIALDTRERLSQFTQEFRYASPDDGPFKYVIGGYYYSQTAKSKRAFILGSVVRDVLSAFLDTQGVPAADIPALLAPGAITTDATVKTISYAVFANGSYDFTDQLSLNAGIRYSNETKTIATAQTAPPALDIGGTGQFVNLPATSDRFKDHDFSPTVGLSYKFSDRVNAYVRYSKGFKSGGWNAELFTPEVVVFDTAGNVTGYSLKPISFRPESIENYEFGLKSELLGRKLRINLAVFQQDYSDIQISQFVGGVQGFSTTNAAKARSRGFEFEVNARPLRGFDFSASLGYADSRYRRYLTVDGNGDPADFSGTKLQTPRWTATIGSQYSYPVSADVNVVVGTDYSYRSNLPSDPLDPISGLPAFSVQDARLGIEAGDRWSIYVWGKNIFANNYLISRGVDTAGAVAGLSLLNVSYGEPRTFGVRANVKF